MDDVGQWKRNKNVQLRVRVMSASTEPAELDSNGKYKADFGKIG